MRFAILIQYLVPQRALSRLAGWLSSRRWLWFKNWQINLLIRRYGADLNAALSSNIADYPDFNSFFTRRLKPGLRPIVEAANAIACPVDGCISQIGDIRHDSLIQAKGFDFSLRALLGGSETLSTAFLAGKFATLYLAPKDYHRVHMPLTGTLRETVFIPGQLFSVNQATVHHVPRLFARNERLVCIFDTAIGPMAVILVGAMLVGSINTVWDMPKTSNKITSQSYPSTGPEAITLARGAEMGYFKMGSTVIVLFPAGTMDWTTELHADLTTSVGQLFGKTC